MSQEDDADKQYEPTQKKLDDARRKGEIPRPQDVSTAASYAGFVLAGTALGAPMLLAFSDALMPLISRPTELAPRVFANPTPEIGGIFFRAANASAVFFLLPAALVAAAIIAQRGLVFAPEKLAPKLSRISPVQNVKNKFGIDGLFEFAKSATKLTIYSVVLGIFVARKLPEIVAAVHDAPAVATMILLQLTIAFLFVVLIVSATIGAVDFVWQQNAHLRKNRMSRKEMMDEAKQQEGDPYLKQERRQRGQTIAMNRMLNDVPGADVVIVNPTHYAVALAWSREPGSAPKCVAKGVDEIAARIRERAAEAGVPIHSDPPTARALHATVEIGREIPPEHYRAVAAAIRFAESIRQRMRP